MPIDSALREQSLTALLRQVLVVPSQMYGDNGAWQALRPLLNAVLFC